MQAETVWVQPKLSEPTLWLAGQGSVVVAGRARRSGCAVCSRRQWVCSVCEVEVGKEGTHSISPVFRGVSRMFREVSRAFRGRFASVSRRFAGFRGVSRMFREFCVVRFTCFTAVSHSFAAYHGGFAL